LHTSDYCGYLQEQISKAKFKINWLQDKCVHDFLLIRHQKCSENNIVYLEFILTELSQMCKTHISECKATLLLCSV